MNITYYPILKEIPDNKCLSMAYSSNSKYLTVGTETEINFYNT